MKNIVIDIFALIVFSVIVLVVGGLVVPTALIAAAVVRPFSEPLTTRLFLWADEAVLRWLAG